MPQRRHLEPPGWRTATQSARWSWSAAGSEPSRNAYHPERSRYYPPVARQIGRGQTEVRGREVTFPVEVPRGRRFFEVNESGRVDPSMSPIWASPKFRPNSVVELPGHEIHTCNVHQGWCQGSVLQFKTGESTLGADQPLAFSRNLKLWNLSGKLRKVQTPFNFQRVASLQDSEESLGFVRQKRTVRLVTSHWETQQHSDDERCQYCTNLAQFNTRPGFLCFQNQSAKAVCKTLLHDTNTSLID